MDYKERQLIVETILSELKINDRERPLRSHDLMNKIDSMVNEIPLEGIVQILLTNMVTNENQLTLRISSTLHRINKSMGRISPKSEKSSPKSEKKTSDDQTRPDQTSDSVTLEIGQEYLLTNNVDCFYSRYGTQKGIKRKMFKDHTFTYMGNKKFCLSDKEEGYISTKHVFFVDIDQIKQFLMLNKVK